MTDYIDDIFGATGALAAKFKGYSPRPGQIAFARAVDVSIRERRHLLAECPTGTGKSVGYLVPVIYNIKHPTPRPPAPPPSQADDEDLDGVSADKLYEEGEPPKGRAIIVTANIALQEQLTQKDLPLLREVLPWPFTYALLKGVNNFVCLERLNDERYQTCDKSDFDMFCDIRDWALETETGDKSELKYEPSQKLWNHFSVSSDECMGRECPYYKPCFPRQARRRAREADVVVTNYALFFLDLILRERSHGVASILPPYNIAILDEGHKAVDIARDFFGFHITEGMIDWVGSLLSNEGKIDLHKESQLFFAALREHRRQPGYKARIRAIQCVQSEALELMLDKTVQTYAREVREIDSDEDKLAEEGLELDPDSKKRRKLLNRKANRACEIIKDIQQAMQLYAKPKLPWVLYQEGNTPETTWYWSDPSKGGDNTVKNQIELRAIDNIFFIEEEKGDRTALCSIPVSVAESLHKFLFDTTDSVCVTSATLVARNSFDFIANDLGIPNPLTLVAESPFNWREQALLVLPKDVPEPNDARFTSVVSEKFVETINFARGRTLGLFTSYKNLNAAYEHARHHTTHRILRQGDMPRTKLIDEFRKDVNSVLMGVESFWAGVDVQGESLSCVFIDRLPFATPDDPLIDALSETNKDWFKKYSIPQAIIAFKQGFGRLIRTTTDKGVVVLLDKRVTSKWYGAMFIASLPSIMQSANLEDVRRFLDGEQLVYLSAVPSAPSTARSLFDGI